MTEATRVLITGANGFIGSAVTRLVLQQGYHVTTLIEPGTDTRNLEGLEVDKVPGDLRDPAAVETAMAGCDGVFHVAALYRFWAPDARLFYEVNVDGTRNVLSAARRAGVRKVVYTGTVGTIGVEGAGEVPSTETSYPELSHLFGSYKRSKYVAEHEVLRAAAEGCPVSIVMPTFPLGPGDRGPTPTGRLVVDYLNGRIPGYVDTVLNTVHVDDVARGHLLAFEKGAQGRSYILGGENLTLEKLLAELSSLTGLRRPDLKVPRSLSLAAAWVSDHVEGGLLHRHPSVPLEAARMSTTRMAFDDSRAREELGYVPRPAVEALEASARWFLTEGFVREKRRSMVRWTGQQPID
ncbi:MAG TPA: hopanoid-associated sugar epimerase [Acidimicrobiales bacterium]|nr:hopanoid-associated sugar epimerase [Acidimicrobiales bacterium]